MYSGTLYETEEKVTRTEMVELLMNAKECVFTVTFRKKIQPKDIEDTLSAIKTDAQLKNCKDLAKQLTEG